MLGLQGGDGAVRMMDNQEKRCPLYNNGWLSLITESPQSRYPSIDRIRYQVAQHMS